MTDAPPITPLLLPDDQYVDKEFKKVQVYIHHTASDGNPFEVQKYWISNKEAVATAFIIGGRTYSSSSKWTDGEIFQCFPEAKGGWHLGLKASDLAKGGPTHKSTSYLNMGSIGIEMCNWGGLVKNEKGHYLTYDETVIPEDQVIDYTEAYPPGWRGFKYYQKYTPAQIESLRLLLTYLCQKYSILTAYQDTMWDIAPKALQGVNGIWTHVSVRPPEEKQDCHPQPELISMLEMLSQQ